MCFQCCGFFCCCWLCHAVCHTICVGACVPVWIGVWCVCNFIIQFNNLCIHQIVLGKYHRICGRRKTYFGEWQLTFDILSEPTYIHMKRIRIDSAKSWRKHHKNRKEQTISECRNSDTRKPNDIKNEDEENGILLLHNLSVVHNVMDEINCWKDVLSHCTLYYTIS